MKRFWRTLAVIAMLAAATATAIHGYTTYGEWGTLQVPFYVNPANADVSQNAAISALQGGMETWNTQSGTAFRFVYSGQSSSTTTGNDQKNIILFRGTSSGSTIATTYAWSQNGVLVDSDIVFWDGGFTFFTGSSGCTGGAYVEDIAAHELGHAMGLQHSSVTDATMYPTYSSCSQAFRSLSADDIAGAKTLYSDGPGVPDAPPTVKILTPANGASFSEGTAIAFSGSAIDAKDGDISSRLTWKSNISGQIGTGASFTRSLPTGSHTITATAVDSIGFTTQAGIVVTVAAGTVDTAPSVTITAPTSGTTVTAGSSVAFSGSASDTQDGVLTSRLSWRSSIDGSIGSGGTFNRALTPGTHTITASVTDSGGLTTQRSITVYAVTTTSSPTTPPPTGMTLTARGYKVKGQQKVDLAWSGFTSSSVDIYRNSAKITTTPNDGAMTDAIDQKGNGAYTYKVCAASTTTCSSTVSVTF